MRSRSLGTTGVETPAPDHAGSATVASAAKQVLYFLEEPMLGSWRLRLIFGLALAVFLGTVTSAEAAFKLRISDGTTTKIVTDNGVGDSTPTVAGNILFIDTTSFAGFAVTVATGTSKPMPPNGSHLAFEDIALSVTYVGAGTGVLTIDLTDTNFNLGSLPGPAGMKSAASNNSSAGVSLTFQSYVNYGAGGNNEFGGIDPATGSVFTTGLQGPLPPSPNTATAVIPDLSNPFSMSSRTVLTFGNPGTASADNNTTVATPAPAGLLLALSASPAFGLGYWFRRRRAAALRVA